MRAVWLAPLTPTSLKLTALALADMCNDSGGSLHPSMATIATRVGVSRSQAQRLVHALIDARLLSVVGNPNGGAPGATPRYHLHIDRLRLMSTGGADATGIADATGSTGATGSANAAEGSHGCMQGAAPMRQTGSTDATQSIKNHQRTTKEPSLRRAAHSTFDPVAALVALAVPEQLATDYNSLWNRSPLTATAIKDIEREAAKAGCSIPDALIECCARGLRKFQPEWLGAPRSGGAGVEPGWRRTNREHMAQLAGPAAAKSLASPPDFLDVQMLNVARHLG
jgi:hypothetical protein